MPERTSDVPPEKAASVTNFPRARCHVRDLVQFKPDGQATPGEVRGATRDEFDRKKAVWHIPAERMKMRAPHDVPLSKQALSVLEEV
jgi:integrase